MILALVFALFLIFLVNRQVIKPVLELNETAKQVERGDLNVRADSRRQDELGQLSTVFNSMIANIRQDIINIQEEERPSGFLKSACSRRRSIPLHPQHPEYRAVDGGDDGVSSISKALVSFMRIMDYNFGGRDSVVTVKTETECLEEYIYLQKLRCQNKFISRIEIEKGFSNTEY
jgi:two-component system sensor histidine kinase YesM